MDAERQPPSADNAPKPERLDIAVVGGGQAGLAIGYFLAQQARRFVILEAADSVGSAWKTRWDSLVLFTPRRYSGLPGLPFAGNPDGYPTRDEVITYLEQYAREFKLPARPHTPVRRVSVAGEYFVLELENGRIEAEQVVIATGPFQVPRIPGIAGQFAPDVFQIHSTGYMRPSDLPPGTVLVVGGGNTGYQVATELSSTHRVHLAVGSQQTPLPQRFLGRDLFWWLTKTGLIEKTVETRLGQRLRHRDTLIGSSPRDVRRHGVTLKPRFTGASGRTATFADGSEVDVDAVIWATGYRSDYSWIDAPIFDSSGRVDHRRGVTGVPGLFFLGLTWQHTRGSALIGWVRDDAEFIAKQIEASARGRQPERERETPGATRTTPRAEEADVEHENFPRETGGLSEAMRPEIVELQDGDEFDLRIEPVAKRIGDETVRMLAYNRSIPGPTLNVQQGSKLIVHVTNEGDHEATVHWHGLRLENRYDGTHETQAPIPIGETFTYEVSFPDIGAYWYHPHIREDYGQEMGLYGNILVAPPDPDYWPPAHREHALTLDDILIEEGQVAAFSPEETTHVAMGRFGNVMLVSGEADLEIEATRGEVVRFYLTNTANTRVFNVALPGSQMKLVGADSGHYEREGFVDSVLIAPSERVVVDVLFAEAGTHALEHQTPERTYRLATITVGDEVADPPLADDFRRLRTNADMAGERQRVEHYLDAEPDKTLAFVAEMDLETPEGPVVYACPMHPEVESAEPGRCSTCGMTLLATAVPSGTTYACPMHPEVTSDAPDKCPKCGMKLIPAHLVTQGGHEHGHEEHGHEEHGHEEHYTEHHESHDDHAHEHDHAAQGIEWEDDMVEVNRMTTPANMRWKLVDRSTGAENAAIAWRFRIGDQVKIRLVNEMDSDHPMPHPFHIHGAGRFLILSRDGEPEPNLVWKDTVLVRTGENVDILLDVTNPGHWMAHCHIAEHHESGMMFSFDVDP